MIIFLLWCCVWAKYLFQTSYLTKFHTVCKLSAPSRMLCKWSCLISAHDLSPSHVLPLLYTLLFYSWGLPNVCVSLNTNLVMVQFRDMVLVRGYSLLILWFLYNFFLLTAFVGGTKLWLVWDLFDVYSVAITFLSVVSWSWFKCASTLLIKIHCCCLYF